MPRSRSQERDAASVFSGNASGSNAPRSGHGCRIRCRSCHSVRDCVTLHPSWGVFRHSVIRRPGPARPAGLAWPLMRPLRRRQGPRISAPPIGGADIRDDAMRGAAIHGHERREGARVSGYQEALGALVLRGGGPAIRWARTWRMRRWTVNVTAKYSSRDAEPRPDAHWAPRRCACQPLPSTPSRSHPRHDACHPNPGYRQNADSSSREDGAGQ